MKIFITGISSPIVRNLVKLIDLQKVQVIGMSRKTDLKIEGVSIVTSDLAGIRGLSHVIADCDMIIHAAALTHSTMEKKYFEVNYECARELISLTQKHSVKRFVYVSSNTAGYNAGSYSLSKMLTEELVQESLDSWCIFRLSELFGYQEYSIDELIHKAIRSNVMFCPVGMPSKFYPIHINDVVDVIYEHVFLRQTKNEVINVNGNVGFSFYELLSTIKDISGSRTKIIKVSRRVMELLKVMIRLSPIELNIVPDQIDRLYGHKSVSKPEKKMMSFETYLKEDIIQ